MAQQNPTRPAVLIGGAGIIAALTLIGVLIVTQGANPRLPQIDPVQRARGQTLYATHCARFHGVNLEGQPNWTERLPTGLMPAPPHDASGHTWHHPDVLLERIIKNGAAAALPPGAQSGTPAFGTVLSDDNIRAILASIKSTWPIEIQQRHEGISRQAR